MPLQDLSFIDNSSITGQEDKYVLVTVDTEKVLKSWKSSLYSFEWLYPDGSIRAPEDLPLREREKREAVEKALKDGQPLERPVLGIGMLDCAEIGSGRAIFLTLIDHGYKSLEVHVSGDGVKSTPSLFS